MTRDQLGTLTLRQLREMATKIDIFAPLSINGVALDHRDMIDYIMKNQEEKMKLYQIVQCYNMTTGEVFWRVYDDGKTGDNGIADFPTVLAAAKAVQRFIDVDKRRAKI